MASIGRASRDMPMSSPHEQDPLPMDFFARKAEIVALALIGVGFWLDGVGGTIVETEAYDATDPASHCFHGPTPRNASMFGPPGHAYVYRSYGIHWCINFVCLTGSGVLIRALEPKAGLDRMAERRRTTDARRFCAGPGRLCQALDIDIRFNGWPLNRPPFVLRAAERGIPVNVGPRIGISKGIETPWRFCLRGSRFLSRPSPSRAGM